MAMPKPTSPVAKKSVTVDARTLRRAMKPVASVVERRNTIPILSAAMLSYGGGNTLNIRATDLDIEASTDIDVIDGEGEWSICIDAKIITDIARAAGVANIEIEVRPQGERSTVTTGDGSAVYEVYTQKSDDYPHLNADRGDVIETFSNGSLAAMLNKVAWSISTEETRYYLNGVCWQRNEAGCRLIATDGHRMALCRYSAEPSDQPLNIIVPRKTVSVISRHMPNADISVFQTTKTGVVEFYASGLSIKSKLIDGTFPDIDRVIPRADNIKRTFALKRAEVAAAMAQVRAIGGTSNGALTFKSLEGGMSIERRNVDFGNVRVAISTKWAEPDAKPFAFNGRYFSEILDRCGNEVSLRMIDPNSPFLIGDNDETMTRVIMPMRV